MSNTAIMKATPELLQDLEAIYPGWFVIEEILQTTLSHMLVRFSCSDLPPELYDQEVTFNIFRKPVTVIFKATAKQWFDPKVITLQEFDDAQTTQEPEQQEMISLSHWGMFHT